MQTDVAAVMFTDLAGYTQRTSQQSHAQNAAMLKRLAAVVHPLVTSFGGRVIKEMGDGTLSTFPSPTSAAEAAMAIQDRLAELNAGLPTKEHLRVRVAINVGELRRERGDVFGEAVNIAARLESVTPPGAIYLSESTYLTMNRVGIRTCEVGTRELKGLPEPVRIYAIPAAPRVAETGSRPDTLPYAGRQLNRLRRAQRRRRALGAATVAAVLAAGVWGGRQGVQTWLERGIRGELRAAVAAGNLAQAADLVVTLREGGAAVEEELGAMAAAVGALQNPARGCAAAARLQPWPAELVPVVDDHRLGHALTLLQRRELAQAEACLRGMAYEEDGERGRRLALSQLHLQALRALVAGRGPDLRQALLGYETFLAGGPAPAEHRELLARVVVEGYLHGASRPVADSLIAQFLKGHAARALGRRILDPDTATVPRAWMLARLESLDLAEQPDAGAWDWTALYATVLDPQASSTCAMRRSAIAGLRRLAKLSAVGLLMRELNRGDRCTRAEANEAIGELVASGKVELPNRVEPVMVAVR